MKNNYKIVKRSLNWQIHSYIISFNRQRCSNETIIRHFTIEIFWKTDPYFCSQTL